MIYTGQPTFSLRLKRSVRRGRPTLVLPLRPAPVKGGMKNPYYKSVIHLDRIQ
jgi:hypothetical protein